MNHCKLCCRLSRQHIKVFKTILTRKCMHNQCLQSSCKASQRQYTGDTAKTSGRPSGDEEDEPDVPYTFSTSKAAKWSVEKSFGSHYSRPLWKVAPLSLGLVTLIAWIFLRPETELDRRLEVTLSERLPDLFPPAEGESEEEETQDAGISPS